MKKIIIIASLSNFIKQFEKYNIKLLKELNYKIYIAANDEENIKEIQGVNIFNIPFTRFPLSINNLIGFFKLLFFIKNNDIDIIDCHTPTGGVLGRIIGLILNKKVIYTAHGFHFFKGSPILNWVIYFPIEYFLSFITDILITINNEDYILAKKKFKMKEILKIPGVGLDTNKFLEKKYCYNTERKKLGFKETDIILLSIGELSSRKNHQIIIKALKELKIENIYYLIIGEGHDKRKYERMIKEYVLTKNIKLLGKKENILLYCQIADIFVHPSRREGLGIAALEGMASGLPLIASNINGIKDYTQNGITGINVHPNDINGFKEAILKLSNDIYFRKNCGKNNEKIVKKYDFRETNKIMEKLYANLK